MTTGIFSCLPLHTSLSSPFLLLHSYAFLYSTINYLQLHLMGKMRHVRICWVISIFFFFFFFSVISTFSRCNLERVQAPAVTEKGHGRIWRMADVEALLWLKPYRCCPAYLWTRVLIWALAVSIVFAQKDSLGTRNKWPLLVMRNGSSFHLSSAQQLTLSCPSFKARGSAFFCWFRQVYNIHWWYENSILKLKNRMPSGVNMAFLGAEERVRASLQFHV